MTNKVLLAVFLILIVSSSAMASTVDTVRIGYFEAGSYYMHKVIYGEVVAGLERLCGDSLEFLFEPTAYMTADWKRERCQAMARDFARKKNIDLIMAAGPWVINDLIEAGVKTPIVGIYQFDPYIAGLISNTGRPVAENLTVNYDPNRLKNDLDMLYKLFPTDRIGVLYFPEGDETKRFVDEVYRLVGSNGATVYNGEDFNNEGLYSFFKSFAKIKDNIKALYLPPLYGLGNEQIRQFMNETMRARVPVFTAEGYGIVDKGATASNTTNLPQVLGQFNAYKIIKIAKGAKPADLPTVYTDFPSLCLNLESAKIIGRTFSRKYILNSKTIPVEPGDNVTRYSLKEAIGQAERENINVFEFRKRLDRLEADTKAELSALYPELNLSGFGAVAGNENEAAFYDNTYNRALGADLVLSQKLLSYPSLKAIQTAKKHLKIEQFKRDDFMRDLRYSVIRAYMNIIEIEEEIENNDLRTDKYREYFSLAGVNGYLGIADSLDLKLIEEKLVDSKIETHRLHTELDIARNIFSTLVGRPGITHILLERDEFVVENMVYLAKIIEQIADSDNILNKFKNYMVDLGLNNSNKLKIADMEIGITRDQLAKSGKWYIPEIDLQAKYSVGKEYDIEIDGRDSYWTLGGKVSFPIFNFKKSSAQKRALKSRLDEILYDKDSYRFDRQTEILNRCDRFISQTLIMPMKYYIERLSNGSIDLYSQRFESGDLPALDMIPLCERDYETKRSIIENRYRFFELYADLLNSVGIDYLFHGSGPQKEFYDNLYELLNK